MSGIKPLRDAITPEIYGDMVESMKNIMRTYAIPNKGSMAEDMVAKLFGYAHHSSIRDRFRRLNDDKSLEPTDHTTHSEKEHKIIALLSSAQNAIKQNGNKPDFCIRCIIDTVTNGLEDIEKQN